MFHRLHIIWALLALTAAPVLAADVPGSEDHPLITRYPGSEITWYSVQEHEPYKIATGPVTGYRAIDDWVETAGKIIRINYELKGERAMYEVFSNYLNALQGAGFQILAEGHDKESRPQGKIGQRGFLNVHYVANAIPPGKSRLLDGTATAGGSGFVAAKLDRPQGTVYVVVGTAQLSADTIVTLVDIIETKPLDGNLITVDAEAMSRDIDNTGRTTLEGVYFDQNKATLKPESKPALEEIAKLLAQRPELNAYIVGHTDMDGALDYNLNLSRDRAEAVVNALTKDHGVAPGRLQGHGVGPLAPRAANTIDAGKAQNRRVELVAR